MPPTESNKPSAGPVIAIIIVLAIIILGGLYFWGARNNGSATAVTPENVDEVTSAIKTQSSSDSVSDIEADLNATDVDTLDAGLNNI